MKLTASLVARRSSILLAAFEDFVREFFRRELAAASRLERTPRAEGGTR